MLEVYVCVYVLTIEEETSKHTIRTRAENLADTMVAIRRTSTEGCEKSRELWVRRVYTEPGIPATGRRRTVQIKIC